MTRCNNIECFSTIDQWNFDKTPAAERINTHKSNVLAHDSPLHRVCTFVWGVKVTLNPQPVLHSPLLRLSLSNMVKNRINSTISKTIDRSSRHNGTAPLPTHSPSALISRYRVTVSGLHITCLVFVLIYVFIRSNRLQFLIPRSACVCPWANRKKTHFLQVQMPVMAK